MVELREGLAKICHRSNTGLFLPELFHAEFEQIVVVDCKVANIAEVLLSIFVGFSCNLCSDIL